MSRSRLANLPIRLTAGAFILNAGLKKLNGEKEASERVHKFAVGAYPALEGVPPERFVQGLAAAEIALGGALLSPFVVGDALAGVGLSAFAGGLLGLYAKTPGMRMEGSVRPSQNGTALAKDSWLAGMGLTLLASTAAGWRADRFRRNAKKARGSAKAT